MENKIDCYIASLPRQLHVIKTIDSILNNKEIGSITITCNKYSDEQFKLVCDLYAEDTRVKFYRGDNAKQSNEKLKYIGNGNNKYVSLCDDDIIYPNDYFTKLINGCELYNAAVGLHGVIMNPRPIKSYYRDRQVFRGLGTVGMDVRVDMVSNCGSLFKREWHNDLSNWYDLVGDVSMDDIYTNYFHMLKGIRRYVLAHNEGYIKHKQQFAEDEYVFDKYKYNDSVQTVFINKYWK